MISTLMKSPFIKTQADYAAIMWVSAYNSTHFTI